MGAGKLPPIIVAHGDDDYMKRVALDRALDTLLPPDVDRDLALCTYDAGRGADDGGPTIGGVLEDLATLPFLSDRRVVLIRSADAFVTAHRERLERYMAAPSATGTLMLECRAFPKTTRLSKAAEAAGGQIHECKKLFGRALIEFATTAARQQGKRIEPAAAARLADLIGSDTGLLASEVEKLALYVGPRDQITSADVRELVGQAREEKIFVVMDAAGAGRLADALALWHQVIETDRDAPFRAIGGMAFVVRRWLVAHEAVAAGTPIRAIAPKLMMWGREAELENILRRLQPRTLRRLLAALADLDSQAKVGQRSIETGVELLLVKLAASAA